MKVAEAGAEQRSGLFLAATASGLPAYLLPAPLPRCPTALYIAGRFRVMGSSTNKLQEFGMPRRVA
jgi:hypothetical protein